MIGPDPLPQPTSKARARAAIAHDAHAAAPQPLPAAQPSGCAQQPLRRIATDRSPPDNAAAWQSWRAGSRQWPQRVGPLCVLPSVLLARGVDPVPVLGRCGLAADALDDPDGCIALGSMIRLLDEAAGVAQCPHLGLEIGAAASPAQLGALGDVMQHGPTVGQALQTYVDCHRLQGEGLVAFTLQHGDAAEFGFVAICPGSRALTTLYDMSVAAAAAWVRRLSGGSVRPQEVRLPRLRAPDATAYREHFGCRVVFESNHAALLFERAALAREVRQPDLHRRIQLGRSLALPPDDLVAASYRSIRLLLTTARTPNCFAFAQQLRAHERTLRRRLAVHRVRYRDMLAEVRYDLARQLLAETRRDMSDIAQACGYSDATAFQRAFRRWSGVTPGEWRARCHAGRLAQAPGRGTVTRSGPPAVQFDARHAGGLP